MPKGNEFNCGQCGDTFIKTVSDEQAQAERRMNGWGDVPDDDLVLICDDCYNIVMEQMNGPH